MSTASNRWYDKIIAAHTTVTNAVSHGEKLSSDRYFVWLEDSGNDLTGNGKHVGHSMTGYTDLFTKTEFDTWVDSLGAAFDSYGIAWELTATTYEENTGFFHHTWEWEVRDG